jgi:hypothetical protein
MFISGENIIYGNSFCVWAKDALLQEYLFPLVQIILSPEFHFLRQLYIILEILAHCRKSEKKI